MSDYLPCYAQRIGGCGTITNKKEILKYINNRLWAWSARNKFMTGIIVISLTEMDKGHKEWFEVIEGYNDVAIVSTVSKYHQDYNCWMCCIPVFQNLGRTI